MDQLMQAHTSSVFIFLAGNLAGNTLSLFCKLIATAVATPWFLSYWKACRNQERIPAQWSGGAARNGEELALEAEIAQDLVKNKLAATERVVNSAANWINFVGLGLRWFSAGVAFMAFLAFGI